MRQLKFDYDLEDLNTVLVVIDMQDYFRDRGASRLRDPAEFLADWDAIVDTIVSQVAVAKRARRPVVMLEYNLAGPTVRRIAAATRHYDLARHVTKYRDNGADEVAEAIEDLNGRGYRPTRFQITGVNRRFCVSDTVRGLAKRYPEAQLALIEDAIGDEGGDVGWGWREGSEPRNTVLVNSAVA